MDTYHSQDHNIHNMDNQNKILPCVFVVSEPSQVLSTHSISFIAPSSISQRSHPKTKSKKKEYRISLLAHKLEQEIQKNRLKITKYEKIMKSVHKLKGCIQNEINCQRNGTRIGGHRVLRTNKVRLLETIKRLGGEIAYEMSGLDIDIDDLRREKKKYENYLMKMYQITNLRA